MLNVTWRRFDQSAKQLIVGHTTKRLILSTWNELDFSSPVLNIVKAKKLAYCGHNMRKQGSCLKKEIMQGTMPGARKRGRPRTAWVDNIKTWTGLSVEESVRMTEDRDKWRKYVHGVVNRRIARTTKEQNSIPMEVFTLEVRRTGLNTVVGSSSLNIPPEFTNGANELPCDN